MEVGSGDWPEGNRRGLADDPAVVAELAALGLTIGGRSHGCPNFCREDVTAHSDVLASLVEDLMVRVVRARPTYWLTVKSGRF